ncbi:HNH endonuclease [Corynebacterium ureicelerivorans]|uniref:HNH endonuclease n=1 Tax=Corynebacterium ureicelerivorans TaxID=401472 RepID=UPI001F298906|nr:HNH endonuclease [Corynebacterium ureicelerivorans]
MPNPIHRQKINGRNPINARFAGNKWRDGDPAKMPPGFHEKHGDIYFTDEGFPILDRFVAEYDPKVMRGEANSTDFVIKPTGDRDLDIAIADHKLGTNAKFRQERGLVWHHHQDCGCMQLIEKEVHNEVRHTGGVALWPTLPDCL